MKKITIVITMIAVCLLSATADLAAQSKTALSWYNTKAWLNNAPMEPVTPAIDIDEFAEHYAKYPNRWKTVFEYLATQDLKSVPLGLVELSENVKVNVQEYETRPVGPENPVWFERHDKYIDVQCIITGEELHGAKKVGDYPIVNPYSEKDDIMHYTLENVPFYIVKAGQFTIFFPDDMHTTNYGFGAKTNVRKLVFKVKAY